MFRVASALGLAALAAFATVPSALAGDARVTRIEPRPFYGATVTLEAGVRVFRPLPPHKNIIINPGHRTPLHVSIKDVTEKRTIKGEFTHNYYDRSNGGYAGRYVTGAPFAGFGLRRHKFHRRHRARGFPPHVRRAPKFRRYGHKGRRGRSRGGRTKY